MEKENTPQSWYVLQRGDYFFFMMDIHSDELDLILVFPHNIKLVKFWNSVFSPVK